MVQKSTKFILAGITIGVLIAIGVICWAILFFLLEFAINQGLYMSRLGLNWFRITLLDGVGIFLVPAIVIILLLIVTTIQIPFRSSYLRLASDAIARARNVTPSEISWPYHVLFNYGLALIVGLSASAFFVTETNLDFALYTVMNLGMNLPSAMSAILFPFFMGHTNIEIVFMYADIIYPLIALVLGFCIAKIVALLIHSVLQRETSPMKFSTLKVTGYIFLMAGLILLLSFLTFPVGYYDYLGSLVVFGVFEVMIACFIIGLIAFAGGLFVKDRRRTSVGRIYAVSVILFLFIGIFATSVFGFVGVSSLFGDRNWHAWIWDSRLKTTIDLTRKAAGIENINQSTTANLISLMNDSQQTLSHIRQFDYGASRLKMQAKIGSNWEVLADSDIVFLPGLGGENEEFWIAPRSISPTKADSLWIDVHYTYSHSRGFVALRAATGTELTELEINNYMGVNSDYPVYFGESFDNGYFLMDAGIGTSYEEIDNATYSGDPDVTLRGLLGWLYIDDFGFKSFGETRLVVKRNIRTRVGDMLLKNLEVGDDPYIVFNKSVNKTYYVVDILLRYPKFSYMESDLLRWMGFCLVDVQTGDMELIGNPNLDLTGFRFAEIYRQKYDWKDLSDAEYNWLVPQLKYPEDLFEDQIEIDYTYHVDEPTEWRSEQDFFERPGETDLHHVMYDLGKGNEFVGMNIVEIQAAPGKNLAGMYLNRYASTDLDNLGGAIFYRTTEAEGIFIGTSTALEYFRNAATQNLTLIQNQRFGNFLLYPFEGSLWYVIPVYSQTTSSATLQLVGLVDAFTLGRVFYGPTVFDAFAQINVTTVGNVTLDATAAGSAQSGSETKVTCQVTNNDIEQYDVTLNLSIGLKASFFADYNNTVQVMLNGSQIQGTSYNDTTPFNVTYHIANWTLIPDEFRGIVPRIMVNLTGSGLSSLTFSYVVELFVYNATTGSLTEYVTKTLFLQVSAV